MTEITTERLVLKKPGLRDKQSIVSQIGDWEVVQWLSEVPYPYTEDDADDWISTLSRQELTFNIYRSDTLIGGIRLTHDDDGSYQLGYWLGRVHWGQGFATEACKGLLHYAAEVLDVEGQGTGATRRVQIPTGEIYTEKCVVHEPASLTLSYMIMEGPMPCSNYLANVQVETVDERRSLITWSCTFDAPEEQVKEIENLFENTYQSIFIASLRNHFASG